MKQILIFIFCLLFPLVLSATEKSLQDKVTLNSGEVYFGKIEVENNDIVMLVTKSGARYQFQRSEVKTIEKNVESDESTGQQSTSSDMTMQNTNFGGVLEFTGGSSKAQDCFGTSPNMQISLTFGNKKVLGKALFAGIGIGYNQTFAKTNFELLPVFARIQSTLSKGKTAPFIGMDAGYAFALNSSYGGGPLVKLSAGITHRINFKSSIYAGIYVGVQSFSAVLTEIYDAKPYVHYDQTSMKMAGLKLGLQF